MADSSPSPSVPESSAAKAQRLKQWLPLYLKRTDATIAHLQRILATSAGTDTTLLAINYSLVAIVAQLDRISRWRLEKAALQVAAQVDGKLLPGEALVAAIVQDPNSRLARSSKKLRNLADLISDFRIFVRLWGLLGIWQWGSGLVKEPPRDKILRWIAWSQVCVNVAYQCLENGAYLGQHGILDFDSRKQTKWWVWSSRFWMAHVALDFGRLYREKTLKQAVKPDGEEKEGKIESVKREEKWWREAYVNAAYAPLTLHWSLENGAVSEGWVGVLGAIAGVVGFREMWRQTA